MANIPLIQDYARTNGFGLTAPLNAAQVQMLAEYWLPEMRFHFDERYHPITLDQVFDLVVREWEELTDAEKDSFRLRPFSSDGAALAPLDPPWVFNRAGFALDPDSPTADPYTGLDYTKPVYEVLGNGTNARDGLSAARTGEDTFLSSGAHGRAARAFFGGSRADGDRTGIVGAPLLPRATTPVPESPDDERRTITVLAALMNLKDLLKYELTLALDIRADGRIYGPDRLRGAFGILDSLLLRKTPDAPFWSLADMQAHVLLMIETEEGGESALGLDMPFGWYVNRTAWNHLWNTTFLEYSFFYAYNDFERVQVAIWDNEHEGDDEGCCLAFDREQLAAAAPGGDEALKRVPPKMLLTSVHEEWQHADLRSEYPAPLPVDLLRPARDYTRVRVYSALGSHATYLTPGSHDLVDLDDYAGWAGENPLVVTGAVVAGLIFPVLGIVLLVIALIIVIAEHFIDTEDYTSDDGAWAGPPGLLGGTEHGVHTEVLTIPMSAGESVYEEDREELLALRAYTGHWGGHDGLIDKSPAFIPKSARFFRKLIS